MWLIVVEESYNWLSCTTNVYHYIWGIAKVSLGILIYFVVSVWIFLILIYKIIDEALQKWVFGHVKLFSEWWDVFWILNFFNLVLIRHSHSHYALTWEVHTSHLQIFYHHCLSIYDMCAWIDLFCIFFLVEEEILPKETHYST